MSSHVVGEDCLGWQNTITQTTTDSVNERPVAGVMHDGSTDLVLLTPLIHINDTYVRGTHRGITPANVRWVTKPLTVRVIIFCQSSTKNTHILVSSHHVQWFFPALISIQMWSVSLPLVYCQDLQKQPKPPVVNVTNYERNSGGGSCFQSSFRDVKWIMYGQNAWESQTFDMLETAFSFSLCYHLTVLLNELNHNYKLRLSDG